MHKLVRGAIAGTIATLPMTLVMISLFRKLPPEQRYPLPPRLLMENFFARTRHLYTNDDAALTHATLAAHFAYGAATGAMYPYLERRPRPDTLTGIGFGLGVWAASYLGWIPAAKLLDPATRHPARRNALMLTAHVVWGAALARVSAALCRVAELRDQAGGARFQPRSLQTILQGETPFSRPGMPASRGVSRRVTESFPSNSR